MPSAGISVNPECVEVFNELKLKKELNYIIFAVSKDGKEIVVDEKGTADYDDFRTKLIEKVDPNSAGKIRPSFGIYDIQFELEDGGKRSKLAFITYIDGDSTAIRSRMIYASSREDLKSSLTGIAMDWQASDKEELEYKVVLEAASKGQQIRA